ncbi:phosphoenolpyruvate--protein phosphotransferase [uncultured Thiodictyon sp.]|uniref:phosphoenolpyruvate--protein phosphotransferase n=1 Tax=uncultured Thiodictyon sp. TaxID=1846217 RepID=UPI0025EE2BF1|nr:phosphoenolpyruvate--protein phosphotransferase [uncultured Thiodictyon sp.]
MQPHGGGDATSHHQIEEIAVRTIELKAPLDGVTLPLEQVPDPVFAQKMVGDGLSLDPLSQVLLAPCAGTVTNVHRAGHAVTLVTPEGIELMMHIGLDTVNLQGEGFTPKVAAGAMVVLGDPLIAFDADYLATHAKSLLTQIVVTNGERVAAYHPATGLVQAGVDTVLTLDLAEGVADEAAASGKRLISEAVLIPNPTGLHARPAAVLANLAKRYQARILIQRGDDQANAKSLVAIMGLAIEQGDKVVLVAEGPDAAPALAALVPELAAGLGDEGSTPAPAPATTEVSADAAPAPRPRSDDPQLLLGVPASPGLAVGRVWRLRREEIEVQETGEPPNQERRRLEDALDLARNQLEALQAELRGQADPAKAAIFAAHQELLGDPGLLDIADSAIAKGKSAAFAWRAAFTAHAQSLARLRNQLLAERANDLRDVGRRVLAILTGTPLEEPPAPPDTILIAEDLTPSDTARLDRTRVLAFATVGGGATSHVAIIARSLDLPAVAGIEPRAMDLADGTPVILDGSKGSLRLDPDPAEIERIKTLKERLAVRRANDLAAAMDPAVTSDGQRIEVVANIGGLDDAARSLPLGGEGVGLLRSEFLYLDRTAAPTEDEQYAIYSSIAEVLDGRPMIIRTLDVGGDKPLAYLPMPREENPMLGIRGVRIGLDRPEILRTQVRAILRAGEGHRLRMMFPMIATLDEIRSVKGLVEEERARLGVGAAVELGIMVEVPAAAVLARQFAREVDFFSIGTNDLTQYTLAMDRGHPKLAAKADAMNPAVLQLIAQTVAGATAEGKWVGVCGGLASDPQAVPILVGLGVAELSVSVPSIPAVKAQVRAYSLAQCQALAAQALTQDSAAAVRALVPLDY